MHFLLEKLAEAREKRIVKLDYHFHEDFDWWRHCVVVYNRTHNIIFMVKVSGYPCSVNWVQFECHPLTLIVMTVRCLTIKMVPAIFCTFHMNLRVMMFQTTTW